MIVLCQKKIWEVMLCSILIVAFTGASIVHIFFSPHHLNLDANFQSAKSRSSIEPHIVIIKKTHEFPVVVFPIDFELFKIIPKITIGYAGFQIYSISRFDDGYIPKSGNLPAQPRAPPDFLLSTYV